MIFASTTNMGIFIKLILYDFSGTFRIQIRIIIRVYCKAFRAYFISHSQSTNTIIFLLDIKYSNFECSIEIIKLIVGESFFKAE